MNKTAPTYNFEKYITIDGRKARYFELGKGKTIIFLGGIAASISVFIPAMKIISKKFHCIAIDLPGFGKSEEFKNKLHNYENYIVFLDKFLSELKIKSPNMVGISFGSDLIIKFATNSKNRPAKIILQSPVYKALPVEMQQRFYRWIFFHFWVIAKVFVFFLKFELFQKTIYKNYADFTDIPWSRFKPFVMNDLPQTSLIAMKQSLTCVFDNDLTPEAEKVTVPTLLLYGSLETWIPEKYKLELSEAIKGCDFRILPNVSHVFVLQNPKLFAQTVANFFT